MIYIWIIIFLVLIFFDLPALIREKNRKELVVYSVLSCLTLIYIIQYALRLDIFSPIKTLSVLVKRMGLDYELWQGHS